LFFLGFVQTATLAHFLRPRDFGLMAAVSVVVGFAQAFGDMGVSSAIIVRHVTSRETLSSLYWLNIAAGLFVFLLILASTPLVVHYFNQPRLRDLLPWAGLTFLIRPLGQQFFVLLERDLRFKELARIEILAAAAGAIVAITAAAEGAGVWALIWGVLAKSIVWSALLLLQGLPSWRPYRHFRASDLRGYLGFGLYQMGERCVTFLYLNVDYLLIGRFLGIEALGAYSLAYQLVLKPVSVFNPIITRVAFPAFAKRQGNDRALRQGYIEMMRAIGFAVAPVMIALAATAPALVPALFGQQWHRSVVLIEILAFVGLLSAVGNPVGSVMLAKNRPDVGFKMNVASVIVMTGVLLVAVHAGLTIVAFAEVGVVFALGLVWAAIIKRTLALPLRQMLAPLVSPLLYAAIAGCLMLGVREVLARVGASDITVVLLTLFIGALAYTLLIVAFERAYLLQLRTLFRSGHTTDSSALPLSKVAVTTRP
jgi:O-antigen/teichoic acid export membrane protein